MKHSKKNIVAMFLIGSLMVFSFAKTSHSFLNNVFTPTALADDNEEDDRGEWFSSPRNTTPSSEEDTSPSSTTTVTASQASAPSTPKKPKTVKVAAPVLQDVVTYQPVTKVVTVTDPGYDIDSDGDALVDALDPDPTRPESEYFTDTDQDGVPDAFDAHHDEDDFAYFDTETDANQNGIIDSYE